MIKVEDNNEVIIECDIDFNELKVEESISKSLKIKLHDNKEIGFLNFIIFKCESIINLLDKLDYEPSSVVNLLMKNELQEHIKYIENNNFVYISKFKIKISYRNQSIGTKALKCLCDYLKSINVNNVYLCSFPIESGTLTNQLRLNDFYNRNGFTLLGKDDSDLTYFYQCL